MNTVQKITTQEKHLTHFVHLSLNHIAFINYSKMKQSKITTETLNNM